MVHMARNKIPLEKNKPASAISLAEANGQAPMSVAYATKLFSLEAQVAVAHQGQMVEGDVLQEKLEMMSKVIGAGALYDNAFDKRGWKLEKRIEYLDRVHKHLGTCVLTEAPINSANPGPYVNGLSKTTYENTLVSTSAAKLVIQLCRKKGGKAATFVNL